MLPRMKRAAEEGDASGAYRSLRLQLIGTPRLVRGGAAVHVGSRKALALLAWLALEPATARDRLATVLWPEQPAAAARRNLRRELFRLRRLGVHIDEAQDGALALAAAMEVDARDAELGPAGSLAAGLDGVAGAEFDDWLNRRRTMHVRQRGAVLSRAAEARAAAGHLAEALALQRLRIADDPCDEAAVIAAMRLAERLDDRATALQLYAQLTAALRGELQLEPSEAVRRLADGLRGTAGTNLPRPATAAPLPLPAAVIRSAFVPRPAVAASVTAAWDAGQTVYLGGVPGAGKTRLASELASARGPWLRVACEANDAGLPFVLAVRLLRSLRDAAPDVELPEWACRELAQLMPELGEAPPPLAGDEARLRLHAALGAAWALLLRDNFSALVIDDWQWSDAGSLSLWPVLDRAAAEAGAVRLVVHRSGQLAPAALACVRADVDARRGRAVLLPGMAADEAALLLQGFVGLPVDAALAHRLHRSTGGNPFFLIETARLLADRGLLQAGMSAAFDAAEAAGVPLPVPPAVRDAILSRVRALGPEVQRLLEFASLSGDDIDIALLGAGDDDIAVAGLELAQAAQLVEPAPRGALRFAHDLVRQCVAESLSPPRRSRMHARLAEALERRGAPPALVAAQFEAAGQLQRACRWRIAAAEAAARVHALDDALVQYRQALADDAPPAEVAKIHLARAGVHGMRAETAAEADAYEAAAAAAQEANAETRLQVALARAESMCARGRADDGVLLVDALQAALDEPGAAPALRARALEARATAAARSGRLDRAQACLSAAIALVDDDLGALPQLAGLLGKAGLIAYRRGDLPAAIASLRRAAAAREAVGDSGRLAAALGNLGATLLDDPRSDRDEVRALLERAQALAARARHVPAARGAILNLVKLHTDTGETSQALILLAQGEALAPGYEHAAAEVSFLEARYYVHYLRGETEAADGAARRLVDVSRRSSDPYLVVGSHQLIADLYLLTGALGAARELLDAAQTCATGASASLYAVPLGQKRAWLALAEGDPAVALRILDAQGATQRRDDACTGAWIGSAAALALGDPDDAERRAAAADIDADVATDGLALLLVQRLALAAARQRDDPPARARAETLLAQGRVPPLVAARLRAAMR